MKKVIKLTESDLMRIVKRVISEQNSAGAKQVQPYKGSIPTKNKTHTGLGDNSFDKNWLTILSGLKNFNSPKVINVNYDGKPITSLNWGIHSDSGRNKNWGLSISSDNNFVFQTKDEIQSKVFKNVMGLKPNFNNSDKSYVYTDDIDLSNPSELISKVKKTILSLG
jgi:hypothetical protein